MTVAGQLSAFSYLGEVQIVYGGALVAAGNALPVSLDQNATGANSVTLKDAAGNIVDLALPSEVVGSVASASTDSGKPVKTGGKYNATQPTFVDGQRADTQLDIRGNARVTLQAGNTNSFIAGAGLTADNQDYSSQTLLATRSSGIKWNGAGWDRDRKPNAVSRIASAAASVNATLAKSAAGDVFKAVGQNAKAAVVYLKLYNKASAPTVGTDVPFATFALPASVPFNIDLGGLYMGTGISYGFTTDAADAGTTALLAGDILGFNLIYHQGAHMIFGARNYNLAFWGDSLTAGTGASSAATQYPYVTANSGSRGRWFYNGGVGGETSTQIKARLLAASADLLAATSVLWVGRNNYTDPTTVKADIAAMIAALGHTRYLVLSIINGDFPTEYTGLSGWTTITTLNSQLSALYGARFVDVRTPLVAAGAPGGSSPSPTDYANDVPPTGIRLDAIHLLDAGHAIVAAAAYAKLNANHW